MCFLFLATPAICDMSQVLNSKRSSIFSELLDSLNGFQDVRIDDVRIDDVRIGYKRFEV